MSQNTKSNPMKNLNPEINVKTYESFISKKFIRLQDNFRRISLKINIEG